MLFSKFSIIVKIRKKKKLSIFFFKLSKSCQKDFKKLSKLSKKCQKVVKKLSKRFQKVVKVVKKMSKSLEKLSKVLWKRKNCKFWSRRWNVWEKKNNKNRIVRWPAATEPRRGIGKIDKIKKNPWTDKKLS
jgi:hypothetical protein